MQQMPEQGDQRDDIARQVSVDQPDQRPQGRPDNAVKHRTDQQCLDQAGEQGQQ